MRLRFLLIFCALALFFNMASLNAQSLPPTPSTLPQGMNSEILEEAKLGQKLIFERQFEKARDHFTALSQKYPASPLGSFGLMALDNAIMFENYDFSKDSSFAKNSELNQKIVAKISQNLDSSSSWDLFLCGASSGLRGFYLIRQDKAFKALGEAKLSRKCLDKAFEKDTHFADVNLGLGMYDYWRSVFTNSIKFLPFFKDRRDEGIQKIKLAADQGVIAGELAKVALMFVYLQERKPQEGLKLTQELLQKYPDNVIAAIHRARFLAIQGKSDEALLAFQEIRQKHPDNGVSLFFIGEIEDRKGSVEAAKQAYENYLKTQPSPAWQSYAYYKLGHIALKQKDRNGAYQNFKAGYKVYKDYEQNLKMILKMRDEDNS